MTVDEILASLTLAEKVALLTGADYWHTKAFPDAGVDAIMLTDGPHGLRKQADAADHLGLNAARPATCFPTPASLASTWDEALVEEVGAALGAEAAHEEVSVVLGPGANIKRDPRCGRNFEYYSEDPLLSGRIAAAMIRGIQSRGVAACLKHFAANNQETDRLRISADVDDRALREIYLASFEEAIAGGHPRCIMSSYNRVNGTYAGESRELLTDVLRDEWGFDGVVVSDWGAVFDRVATLRAGLDLEMPYSGGHTEQAVLEAVERGELDASVIDESARRMLELIAAVVHADATQPVDFEDHHQLGRRAAAAGCVLLRNEPMDDGSPLLPLRAGQNLAIIGEFARTPRYQGAGAAQVTPRKVSNVLDTLEARRIPAMFAPGYRIDQQPDEALVAEAVAAAERADVAVLFLGLTPSAESEGYDRDTLDLPADQLALLEAVAAVNPRVAVVLANGSVVTVNTWRALAPSILEAWLGGQAMAEGVVDVLFGDVCPSGKLTETIPERLQDSPSYLSFPGELGHSRYAEGVFVGYRGHDFRDNQVAYPFGFGLSYTSFQVELLDVHVDGVGSAAEGRVRVRISNTGPTRGAEVIQLYVGEVSATVACPPKQLRAFAKVELDPGEERIVELPLRGRDFAYWHSPLQRWVVEGGDVQLHVGTSSRDIVASHTVTLTGDDLRQRLTPMSTIGELMANPVIGDEIRKVIEAQPAQFQAQAPDIPAITFVDFNIFDLDRAGLTALLDRANAALDS